VKILVADDSATFLQLISDSLTRLGHDVIQARSGAEAIKHFLKSPPDLIILDVMMEGMNGFECAREIRKLNPDDWIPIIFLSASVNDESIAKGIEAGGDDYLTKPYSDVTLEAKIKAMQRIAEMRQQIIIKSEELKRISTTDVLTGLYNRFHFEKVISKKIAAADRHDYKLALLYVDIDHFKSINDTFGHGIGDLLLKEIASRLQSCTRVDDFIARIGGDEFVIICGQIENHQAAGEVAKKIVDELGKEYDINGMTIKVSASIGVTIYPDQSHDSATLIQNADIAMYAAKEIGRNNYQYFTEALNERYRHQLGLEHELKFAVQRNQLFVTYQPIYDLLKKKMVGAEALLRWMHPEYGLISPNVFIPIAEDTGQIVDIGTWVLRHVCDEMYQWVHEYDEDFVISVNLSVHQLVHEAFLDTLSDILKESKIPPSNLELEITESTVITYTVNLKETMQKLNEMGVKISIDDFGTRYSSLTSLRHLPITTLKIDKEFVKNVDKDKKNGIIVKSLIALGENLNLDVIAEGIQSEEQLQYILVNGCRYGQGDFLMKPQQFDVMNKIMMSVSTDKEE
jgi:diguanylate cyclase (GGDEF)-like protein